MKENQPDLTIHTGDGHTKHVYADQIDDEMRPWDIALSMTKKSKVADLPPLKPSKSTELER